MQSEKTSKKLNKIKLELEKENKKPPVQIVTQKESIKAFKNESKITNIKTEEVEKLMLKGQIHIEEKPKYEDKENKEEKKINKIKKPEDVSNPIIKEEKKQILVNPREIYLKEKLSKMNLSSNLISNIEKEMENKIKNIMTEEEVVPGEKTQDLKQYLDEKNKSNGIDNYENKKKFKEIKNLIDELNGLKINLKLTEENEELIKQNDEGNLLMNSLEFNNDNLNLDKTQKLLKLRQKKEKINAKITEINYRLKYSFDLDKTQNISNRQRLKDFLINFERDKEIIEIRAQKYLKENIQRNLRRQNDIIQIMEKRKKEIEEKEQETKNQNEEKQKKFKEQEKVIEQKQSKLNEEILLRYKPYINNKPEKSKREYLYNKRYQSFIKSEEKYFQKKEKNKKYNFDEIEKFAQDFDQKKEARKNIQEQKSVELSQKWAENREKLPKNKYHSIDFSNKKKILEEEKKNEIKQILIKEYSEKVRENFSPEIDINKRLQLKSFIRALEDPKSEAKKYTLKPHKKNRVIMKKRDNTKPSKYNWDLKLDLDLDKEINLVKRPKKINLIPITRATTEFTIKKPDYLDKIIKKKTFETRINSPYRDKDLNDKKSDISKSDENYKNNIIDKINNAKNKVEYMEQRVKSKEKLLKLNGGIQNNPELGKQVSNLYIDSIEAKLNFLKKMNDIQN